MPRTEAIARELGKLGVTWSCNAKANVPRDTLKVMRDNGLRLLLVGYESGNQQILHNIRKGMRIDVARRFTKDCHELGITIHGTFILGLPGESRETIEETIRFATEINPHTIQVSLAAPYPGTELYREALEHGWLDEAHAELIDASGVQMAPLHYPHLGHTEIFQSVEEFYRRFYFRAPKIAAIIAEMVCSPQMMVRRLREGAEFFSFLRERAGVRALNRLIITADDFGLSEPVNAAIEAAHRRGILSAASLMVGAPAAADAVARARTLPNLRVGLHVVLLDGDPVVDRARNSGSDRRRRRFRNDLAALRRANRVRPLAAAADRRRKSPRSSQPIARPACRSTMSMATGISSCIRPSRAAIMAIGRATACGRCAFRSSPGASIAEHRSAARSACIGRVVAPWAAWLRAPGSRAPDLATADAVFGLAWSGAMTKERVAALLGRLPPGFVEIYLHPRRANAFAGAAPGYRYAEEFAALCDPDCIAAVRRSGYARRRLLR